MTTTLFVLWVWLASPWQLDSLKMAPPVPMTAGWFPTQSLFTSVGECMLQVRDMADNNAVAFPREPLVAGYACVMAGEAPPGEVAHIRREQ